MENKNLLVVMSGGTTSVINATLTGILKRARDVGMVRNVYAGYPGILGLLSGSILDLERVGKEQLDRLRITPASGSIGTTRVEPILSEQVRKIERVLEDLNVGYLINIGGNGTIKQSMFLAKKLKNVKVAALPKTVDNDLGDKEFRKVLFTPGFLSCVQYWCHKIKIFNEENLGAFSHDQVLIAQTFGRDTGFIAGAARLADPGRKLPLILLLPEDQLPVRLVVKKIKQILQEFGRAMVVMSEGYRVGDIGARFDPSGQIMYSSSRTTNAQLLVNRLADFSIQACAFIPGFDQRSEALFVSKRDLEFAERAGEYAVEEFERGNRNFFVTVACGEGPPFRLLIKSIPLSEIDDFSRKMPDSWIDKGKFDVTDEYIDYLKKIVDFNSPLLRFPFGKIKFSSSPLGRKVNLSRFSSKF